MAATRRPRLLVLNQYYWPGVEATAHLLTELCEALADEFDVRVVTGVLHGHEDEPGDEIRTASRSCAFPRRRSSARSSPRGRPTTSRTSAAASSQALRGPRPDVVLCMTDPPMVGDIALAVARRFGAPLVVISEDVFPEIALELKRLENPSWSACSAASSGST